MICNQFKVLFVKLCQVIGNCSKILVFYLVCLCQEVSNLICDVNLTKIVLHGIDFTVVERAQILGDLCEKLLMFTLLLVKLCIDLNQKLSEFLIINLSQIFI